MAFEGDLKDLSLGDIFQTIAQNRQTGTLAIALDEAARPRIFFRAGRIALFSPDDSGGPPFAEVLRRGGAIPEGTLGGRKGKGGRLQLRTPRGEWVDVDPAAHREAAERYLADTIGDLFRRPGGRFRFDDGEPRGVFDRDLVATAAALDPQVVAFEGMRRRDEWPRIQRRLRSFEEVFVRRGALAEEDGLSAEARKLHALLDGGRTLEECMASLPCGEFATAAALVDLLERRLCEPAGASELTERALEAEAGGEAVRAERLLRRAALVDPAHRGARDALAGILERTGRGREAGRERMQLAAERAAAGETEAALADYRRAADLLPGDTQPLERAVEIARRLGDRPLELADGKRLAARFLESGAADRAAAVAGEMARRFPEDAGAHEGHAAALAALGRTDEAGAARARGEEIRSGRGAERRARRARWVRRVGRGIVVAAIVALVAREGFAWVDVENATAIALAAQDPETRRALLERAAERHPYTIAGWRARRMAAAAPR